jgi:hypothetical protein
MGTQLIRGIITYKINIYTDNTAAKIVKNFVSMKVLNLLNIIPVINIR